MNTTESVHHTGLLYEVSPFGDFRIKGCLAPPRNLSQPRYVLHRLLESRHPPYALTFLLGTVKTTFVTARLQHAETYIIFWRKDHRTAILLSHYAEVQVVTRIISTSRRPIYL